MTKENLSAIALRVANECFYGIKSADHPYVKFALAFLEEVTKQAEPVAWQHKRLPYEIVHTDVKKLWNKAGTFVTQDRCENYTVPLFDHQPPDVVELKAEVELLRAALSLWKVASDNAEESELDDMACYCIPMPLFCDASEATEALAAPKGD